MARSKRTEAGLAETAPAQDAERPVEPSVYDTALADGPRADPPAEAVAPASPPRPDLKPRRTFLPMFLGGVLAAAAGSAATVYLARTYPDALGFGQTAEPGQDERLAEQDRRIADLTAMIEAMPADAGGIGQEALDALRDDAEKAQGELSARIDQLETRIAALGEDLARVGSAPRSGATAADIAAATEEATKQAQVAAEEAARVRAETESIARNAAISAALSELESDIENGTPLDGALARLTGIGVTLPEALTSQAQGVPTLAALRQSFPEAARDALTISLGETADEGTAWDRLSAFLRSQTKARSLSPRAGDDPDAVLSRAEAALNAGDLAIALKEVETLPEAGRARMAEWAGLAQRRLAAREALAALSAELR